MPSSKPMPIQPSLAGRSIADPCRARRSAQEAASFATACEYLKIIGLALVIAAGLALGVWLLCAEAADAAPLPTVTTDAHRAASVQADAATLHCQQAWRKLAPHSYSPDLAAFFVAEHLRAGLPADTWQYSLCYAISGSDLNPAMICRAGGLCAEGICDTTESHLPREECLRRFGTTDRADSWVSIATHVRQAAELHQATGRAGMDLMRSVFLPGNPDGRRARREERRWEKIWEELP